MEILEHEWVHLAQLRELFLSGHGAAERDYWRSGRLCELYDETFGQRIAWKWRAVWSELELRKSMPRARSVLDWGCGSGIAAREFSTAQRAAGNELPAQVYLWDRSQAAREIAAKKLRELDPRVLIETKLPASDAELDLLLVSHVLGELGGDALEELLGLARRAKSVVWVEPGDRARSRELMLLRDSLSVGRRVLGPCTHSSSCGLNRPERERDWCHSFARPAADVFTRADWREFSKRLKIDLRSVPYSYFALGEQAPLSAQPGLVRILGRPRLEKGHAKIDACDESGVRTLRVLERDAKPIVKLLADPANLARIFQVTADGERVRSIE